MIEMEAKMGKFDGLEVKPGVILIGEPTGIPDTNKMRCLASVLGMLCVVELSVKFAEVK